MAVTPGSGQAGLGLSLYGGPGGPNVVTFDGNNDGTVVQSLNQQCYISPTPTDTFAKGPPGYHVITVGGANTVFVTTSPTTSGTAAKRVLGSEVTFTGSGFAPNSQVTVSFYLSGGKVLTLTATTDGSGDFETAFGLSLDEFPATGSLIYVVSDSAGNYAKGYVTGTINNSVLILNPDTDDADAGPIGSVVPFFIDNFPPNYPVDVYFGAGNLVAQVTTDKNGYAIGSFTVPNVRLGQFAVTAVGAGLSPLGPGGPIAAKTYTVTYPSAGISPSIISLPANGVDWPYSFNVTLSGSGWLPNDVVTFTGAMHGVTVTADANGAFQVSATTSVGGVGSYIVKVVDAAGNSALVLMWVGYPGPCMTLPPPVPFGKIMPSAQPLSVTLLLSLVLGSSLVEEARRRRKQE